MTNTYMVALRAIHIATAVLWAGGTFLLAGYHDTILDAADEERTLRRLASYAGVSQAIGVSGGVALVAGLLLYWEVSGGLHPGWMGSSYGLPITVGAIAGLAAFGVGAGVVGLANNRIEALDETVPPGEKPTPEQVETLERYHRRILWGDRTVAILLLVAVLSMATAQYL